MNPEQGRRSANLGRSRLGLASREKSRRQGVNRRESRHRMIAGRPPTNLPEITLRENSRRLAGAMTRTCSGQVTC